jgi:hypothetical protein
MTVALRDLEGSQTARGTTLVALAQQLAAALGAAAVATSVALLVPARVPGLAETGDDGLAGMLALSPAARGSSAPTWPARSAPRTRSRSC